MVEAPTDPEEMCVPILEGAGLGSDGTAGAGIVAPKHPYGIIDCSSKKGRPGNIPARTAPGG